MNEEKLRKFLRKWIPVEDEFAQAQLVQELDEIFEEVKI
mgnify:FL=1